MITPEQRRARRGYIGASDCAAVLGLSRWGTPLSVWAEKTGQVIKGDEDNLAADLGNELEDFVARRFMKMTGKTVEVVPETLFHPKYPFIACNLDRRVVGERAVLQCKAVSAWKANEWDGEDVPHEYILQELHELEVSGMDRAYIAVLIGNQDFKWKVIERDEKTQADILAREVEFWEKFVVPCVMPAVISARDKDALDALFPAAIIGEKVSLPDAANALAESIEGMSEDKNALEAQIEKAKNELRAMLGEAEEGTTGTWDITWKNSAPRRFDLDKFKAMHPKLYEAFREAKAGRRLTIKKTKEATHNGNPE